MTHPVATPATTGDDRSMPLGPSIVGRDAELRQLADRLRRDRTVAVVGEAGIGKTTLVRAAVAAADRQLYEGGGFATLSWMPYLALRRATGLTVAGDPEVVAARIEGIVGPDVLFVDDVQWTDPATRAVVVLLIDRVALVLAARDGDPATEDVLRALPPTAVDTLRLGGLDDAAATTLLREHRPQASAGRTRWLVEHAGGNPLLLTELAARGTSTASLARSILARLDALTPEDRRALELLALADRPMPAEAIGPAGSRLVASDLAVRTPDGLVAVRHSLIAEAIVGQLDDDRRHRLHGRLAELLSDPAERARHLAAAGRRAEAFDVAMAALASTTDPRARAAVLTIAAETSPGDGSVWRVRAARELMAVGSPGSAIDLLAAPVTGDDDLRALGAAVLASSLDHEGRSDEAWAVIERSRDLRPRPRSDGAIELAIAESIVLINRGHLEAAIAVSERATAAAGEPCLPRLQGNLAALHLYGGRTDRLDDLEAAVQASLAAGDGGAAAGRAMDRHYLTLALRGARPACDAAFSDASSLEALGYHTRAAELRAEAAQALIFAGDLRGAVGHCDALLEEPLGLLSRQRLGYDRGLSLGYLGAAEDAERTFVEFEAIATDSFDGRGALLWCWSEAAFWSGQPRRALDLATEALAFTAFNDAEFVLPSLARAWAEVELGRRPTNANVETSFRALTGGAPELRGLGAQMADDDRGAVAAFDEAAETWAGFHRPRELVCRWAAADGRRRLADPSAVPALESALDAAESIGFEPLAARVRRSLRLAGVRIAAPRGRGPIVDLTAREAEVVALVEEGLSNGEISRRLGLGRPTVARIVASAMRKLGVDRRAQLAARARV